MIRKKIKTSLVLSVGLSACFMSACTTVDLSQVSFEPQAKTAIVHTQNVVQKATHSMMALFEDKGWCKTDLKEKTQTAASVLLNGMDKEQHTPVTMTVVGSGQLSKDISLAHEQVEQITKAAEVYFATTDAITDMGAELTLLESALLTAREAETNFNTSLAHTGTDRNHQEFQTFQMAIQELKTITDSYGERMRSQISARSNRQRS